MSFADLPKQSQEHLLGALGLTNDERQVLWLRYTREYSHAEIAAEMGISRRSVSRKLADAKKHAIKVSRALFGLADDKSKMLIEALGWLVLPWPVEESRRKVNRGELDLSESD